jgi:hypothetical protein
MTDFEQPHANLLTRVSPTLVNDLIDCQKRAAFSSDPSYRSWIRPNTFSALGIAAHKVVEEAFRNRGKSRPVEELRIRFFEIWDESVSREAERLREAWEPAVPPAVNDWPNIQLSRIRAIRRATSIAMKPSGSERPNIPGSGIEVELVDPNSPLIGRADRVDATALGARIVDLKSGVDQVGPTATQIRQLHLYAAIYKRQFGQWPVEVAIERLDGTSEILQLDPEEAERAASNALEMVHRFNETVATGISAPDASPSAQTCRWCHFRPACREYWEALESSWGQSSIFGEIKERETALNGESMLIETRSPVDLSGTMQRVANASRARLNNYLAAVDLQRSPDGSELRFRWSSRFRSW